MKTTLILIFLFVLFLIGQGNQNDQALAAFYEDYYSGTIPQKVEINSASDFFNHYLGVLDQLIENPLGKNSFETDQTVKIAAILEKSKILQITEGNKNRLSYNLLEKSYQENQTYWEQNDLKKMDPLYLCKSGELISNYMLYLGFTKIIRLSSKASRLQKYSIRREKDNFCAYMNLGIGAFYAPVIGGGGLKKSLNYLSQAEKSAKTNHQKYLIYIWLSQVHFKLGNQSLQEDFLNRAGLIFPNGELHKVARRKNSKNETL